MELEVVRLLAAEARRAGRDPASDPIPGLRRDILFASTADEEAGGLAGSRSARRGAAGAAPGGRRDQRVRRGRVDVRRAPVLPDPGRREGLRGLPDHGPRHVGPRLDAARRQRRGPRGRRIVARLAVQGPPRSPRRCRLPRRAPPATSRARPPGCSALLRATTRDWPRLRSTRSARRCPRGSSGRSSGTRQPGRHPRRREVQRHPRRGDDRARLPAPARHVRRRRCARRSSSGSGRSSRPPATSSSSSSGRRSTRLPPAGSTSSVANRRRPRPGRRPAAGHGSVRHRRQAHRGARRPDVRLLAAPPRPGRAVPRALPRRRRARLRRRPPLGPAGPLRCGSAVLRNDA